MWETATDLIIKREELIAKLENFERLASDPNRFFEKGENICNVYRLTVLEHSFIIMCYFSSVHKTVPKLKILLVQSQSGWSST